MKPLLHKATAPVPVARSRRCAIARLAATFLVLAALAGCGSMSSMLSPDRSSLYDRDGVDLVLDHTTGFATIFKEANSTERSCRSVGPDFVTGQGDSISISAVGGGGVSGGKSFDAAVAGGRSPGLLALREILYRACELSLNLNADKQLSMEIYKHFLGKAIDASKALAQSKGSAGETLNGSAPALPATNSGAAASSDDSGSSDPSSAYGSGDQASDSYGSDTNSDGSSASAGTSGDDSNSASGSSGSADNSGASAASADNSDGGSASASTNSDASTQAGGSSNSADGSSSASGAGTAAAQ